MDLELKKSYSEVSRMASGNLDGSLGGYAEVLINAAESGGERSEVVEQWVPRACSVIHV